MGSTLSNLDGLMSWSCLGINTHHKCVVFCIVALWPPNTISIYQSIIVMNTDHMQFGAFPFPGSRTYERAGAATRIPFAHILYSTRLAAGNILEGQGDANVYKQM